MNQTQTQTIAIANNKGGVGKTTTALYLGRTLAAAGLTVIMIDLDGQANLTDAALKPGWDEFGHLGIADVIRSQRPLRAALYPIADRLSLCPSSPALNDVADEMATKPLQLFRLKTALDSLAADIVLIDCPPNLGSLTYAALIASKWLIVPVEPAGWAIDGLQRTVDKLPEIRREIGHAPALLGVLATRVRPDLLAHKTGLQVLSELGVPCLAQIPRREGAEAEAQLEEAYRPVAAYLIERLFGEEVKQ